MANITLGQTQSSGENEKPLVTAGDDFSTIKHILDQGKVSYNVDDVLTYLLSEMSPKHHLVKKTVTPC